MENSEKRILYSLTEYEGHGGWSSIGFSEFFDVEKLYGYIRHRGYARGEALDRLKTEIGYHCQATFADGDLESCHIAINDETWLDIYDLDVYEQNHGYPYEVSDDVDSYEEGGYDEEYFRQLESYPCYA